MSLQQDTYLSARAEGATIDGACAVSTIPAAEAELIEQAIEAGDISLPAPRDHNQSKEKPMAENVAADELRQLIERIERLEEEKKAIGDDVKDVYGEAKSRGYDTKTIRRVIALRKMENHVLQESSALLETYCAALGIQGVLF